MANSLSRTVQAFDLLAAFPRGLTVTDLAEKMSANKSTVSRLLASLVEDGLVERDETGRHFLDVRFWTWGVQAARRLPFLDIARPHMEAAVKECANASYIAVVRGDQTIYLESLTPQDDYAMYNILSYIVPVYACAPGKAILAFSSEDVRESVLNGPLKQFTPNTFATRETLSAELGRIRQQGYAINRGEYYDNNHLAVAAPILDYEPKPVASVCFYGISDEARLEKLIPSLLQLSDVISSSLGYRRGVRELVG
ncbi:MAG TPA: IclR family transcriptional regulator [Dehalococcoidia bacterium]|nr:IclR family transcriptional regulator [Dehalococcoidia bacterium]